MLFPAFKKRILIFSIFTFLFLLAAFLDLQRPQLPVYSDEDLDLAITQATDYLINACDSSGQFAYRINMDPDVVDEPDYNILRHAGTIYSLTMAQEYSPNDQTLKTIQRSSEFLIKHCLDPVRDEPDLLAIWSPLVVTGRRTYAKLGGSGLGLLALSKFEKLKPGSVSIDTLKKLGNFILWMQKEDGSFYSRLFKGKDGRNDEWTSLYYPGEAALGLLHLYDLDNDKRWLIGAAKTVKYLHDKRRGKMITEADHWALIASEKLKPHLENDPTLPLSVDELEAHTKLVCRTMFFQRNWHQFTLLTPRGCPNHAGLTTPGATRLEGLQAAKNIIPEKNKFYHKQIDSIVDGGIRFLMSTQVKKGQYKGAIPRAAKRLPFYHPFGTKKFNRRVTEVQIDYVQHTLSAWVKYKKS